MFKNVSGQKIALYAYDSSAGTPKTGDAANLTAYVNKDWAGPGALGDTSASEISSTNAPGWYLFDLTQAESNADTLNFTGKSATGSVYVAGQTVQTVPASFTSFNNPLTAAQTLAAIGMASANLDTQLAALSVLLTAISAKTTNLPAAPSAVADIPTAAQVADKLLGRSIAGGADGGRTVSQAHAINRNKVQIIGTTLFVYGTDDTTVLWSAPISTDSAALPITGFDPG